MEKLTVLPYKGLGSVISAETISFHHGKHLNAYVTNLNKAIEGTPMADMTVEQLIVKAAAEGLTPVFNNAGQVLNHNCYFEQFRDVAADDAAPGGKLAGAIDAEWGSFEAFKAAFNAAGAAIFGSGWVWLQADAEGKLSIGKYSGADNPVAHGLRPILTFDVWEHAYYLDYQNRRPDYLAALWQIIDWKVVEGRY